MKEEKQFDFILISKYLNNEASEVESIQVKEWISASNENSLEFAKLKKAWELSGASIGNEIWKKIHSKDQILLKIISKQSETINNTASKSDSFNWWHASWIRVAALIILVLGLTSLLIYYGFGNSGNENAYAQYTSISAPKGSKTILYLADGTKIWLNAGSQLKFNNTFNEENRNLILEGEAYFEVAKNEDLPFRVKAGGISVEAIGTVFNIKAYPNEKVVEATLVEGIISVWPDDKPQNSAMLKPNEQIYFYKSDSTLNENSRMIKASGIETAPYTAWINDKLMINSETLQSLAIKLERKYDVKINFEEESLQKMQFTGILENETIEQILEIIKISSSVQYRIDGREIWLLKKQQTD